MMSAIGRPASDRTRDVRRIRGLIYVLLFAAAFAAAAISGAAGFGGALLLLPLLPPTVGIGEAVPLLMVAQLIGNVSRAGLGFREIRWRPVGLFLLGAVPLAIVGALSFFSLPKSLIVRVVGAAILLFVGLRLAGVLRLKAGPTLLVGGGGVVGFLSGLVGSAGPLGAAVFLALDLPPIVYVASEAVTAIVMHAVKLVVYQRELTPGPSFWPLAILLGAAMLLGTWTAKRVIARLAPERFRQIVTGLLIVIVLQMLMTG